MIIKNKSRLLYVEPTCELLNVLPAVQCASPTAANEDFNELEDFTW